jgi:uncharacterized caspase-like protein
VALVIGNGAYRNAPKLPNPPNDAKDVAAALTRVGFDTILAVDADKTGLDDAEIRFARAARDADVAMFYYSGHALQYNGINYLMPVDAKLTDEADLRRMARVDDLIADLQQAKNLRILVLDSCRDNPFAEDLKRSVGLSRGVSVQRGLAKIDNAQGMIVSYATQAGRTAEDGTGRNSPYTSAFLKNIELQDEIGTIFRRIAQDVYNSTNKAQLPEVSLSVIGEFYLHGKVEIRVDVAPGQAAPPVSEAAQAWAATRETTSPAVLQAFIKRFDNTVYADMARARLQELRQNQAAAPPVPPTQPQRSPPPNTAAPPVEVAALARLDANPSSDDGSRYAAIWVKDNGPAAIARFDMTSQAYQQEFDKWLAQGYCLAIVNGYAVGNQDRFAAIWEKKTCPQFVARHNLTSAGYQQEFDKWTAQGYRLKLVSGYGGSGQERYAAIWEKTAGAPFVARHGMTLQLFQQEFDKWVKQENYCLSWVSGFSVGGEDRYAAIWEKYSCPAFEARSNLSAAALQQEFDKWTAQGYRTKLVNGHTSGGRPVYASIWEKTGGPAWNSYSGMTPASLLQRFDQLSAQGYRLVLINGY